MNHCPQCHASFVCGQTDPNADGACWCASRPFLARDRLLHTAEGTLQSCLCPDCLNLALTQPGTSAAQAAGARSVTDSRATPGGESLT